MTNAPTPKLARLDTGEVVEFDFATRWAETASKHRRLLGRGVIVRTSDGKAYKSDTEYYFWTQKEKHD